MRMATLILLSVDKFVCVLFWAPGLLTRANSCAEERSIENLEDSYTNETVSSFAFKSEAWFSVLTA
jgi:hypothetical protein